MNQLEISQMAQSLGISQTNFMILLVLILVWSLYWKGKALWMAAQRADKIWFVLLLIINSAGILDLIYVYILAKPGDPEYDVEVIAEKQ